MNYSLNHIKQFQGIVLGKPGSGKTQVARFLAHKLKEKYGNLNVNAVWSRSNLSLLLERGPRKNLVNFLFLDDLTLMPVQNEELARYFQIRHLINARTGLNCGIVISLLGLHRFYGCPPSIRTNFDFLIFRSAPTNKFDRNFTKSYLGDIGVKLLDKIEIERNKHPEMYEMSLIWLKGTGAGWMRTPLPFEDPLEPLTMGMMPQNINEWSYAQLKRFLGSTD